MKFGRGRFASYCRWNVSPKEKNRKIKKILFMLRDDVLYMESDTVSVYCSVHK